MKLKKVSVRVIVRHKYGGFFALIPNYAIDTNCYEIYNFAFLPQRVQIREHYSLESIIKTIRNRNGIVFELKEKKGDE